jgi:hypothetical protein
MGMESALHKAGKTEVQVPAAFFSDASNFIIHNPTVINQIT